MPTAIYSSAALRTKQREVKDAALKDVVHITENGNGTFVFCSEEIFDQRLREAAEQAAYEERIRSGIVAARRDLSSGNVYNSAEEAFAEARRRRDARLGAFVG